MEPFPIIRSGRERYEGRFVSSSYGRSSETPGVNGLCEVVVYSNLNVHGILICVIYCAPVHVRQPLRGQQPGRYGYLHYHDDGSYFNIPLLPMIPFPVQVSSEYSVLQQSATASIIKFNTTIKSRKIERKKSAGGLCKHARA